MLNITKSISVQGTSMIEENGSKSCGYVFIRKYYRERCDIYKLNDK